ncbi:MAG: TatD family hydrolase [Patescibacteria group bacterium]|jgi:TatD DNase family protein
MIDTHAHLDFKDYDNDRDEVIKRSFANGLEKIINVGANLDRSKQAILIAENNEDIFATVGVHPEDLKDFDNNFRENFIKLAKTKKVVAIGECGLDYFYTKDPKNIEQQKKLFIAEIEIAKELNLPLIIHCRDAYEDAYEILKDKQAKGVMHCYLSNWQMAQKFLDLGFYISFTGAITYKKKEEVLEVVKKMSLDKIMVETDCPYLTPQIFRGERNEPMYVKYVIKKIAEIKGINFDEVEKKTTENAVKLFEL